MKLAKVAVLLSLGSDAVSVKNTPPLNEIYEEVLRNKFESRDNKERLLLEVADLGDELQAADKDQTDSLNALKTELDQIRKDISKKSDQISSMKDSKKKMNGSLDTLKVDFGDRLAKLEMQYTTQQTALRKLTTEAGDKFAQLTTELREEITKSRERERTISEELEEVVVQQDDFMRTTRSRLYELSELEQSSNDVLQQIQQNDKENSKKVEFIQEYEKQTEQKLRGQENEIRMLTKIVNSLQNRLNVEDFKEEKFNEKLQVLNRETIDRIDSLKTEMDYILTQNSPKMNDEIETELKMLE